MPIPLFESWQLTAEEDAVLSARPLSPSLQANPKVRDILFDAICKIYASIIFERALRRMEG